MFRRAMAIAILAVTLAAVPPPAAEAHYIVVGGQLKYHSLLCGLDLRGVQNPDRNPATSVCFVLAQEVELLCENPTEHNTAPGKAGIRTILVGADQVDQSDITGKGTAHVDVLVDTDDLLSPEFCVNPNWHPVLVLVRQADVEIKTYECLDAACTQLGDLASTTRFACVLPDAFTLANPPSPGEPYVCTEASATHVR